MTSFYSPNSPRISQVCRFALVLSVLSWPVVIKAGIGGYGSVNYNPPQTNLQINPLLLPYTNPYFLKITSPDDGALAWPITVQMQKQILTKPASVDDATALSYVVVSGADLINNEITFTARNQEKTVLVTVSFPVGVTPSPPNYAYKLVTTGWPSPYSPATSLNLGSDINASVSVDSVAQPPTVSISTPVDLETLSLSPSQLPYALALNFTAQVAGESPLPITGVTADVSTSPTGGGSSIALTLVGLNTAAVTGSGTILVPGPGTYYVNVSATNTKGTATDSHTYFVVINSPPPTAIIDVPSGDPDYTWFVGSPAVVVPNSFRGLTDAPTTIQGFSVDLLKPIGSDLNLSVTGLTGIGTTTASGQVNLNFFSPDSGQYTLKVTTSNEYLPSAQVAATFWINRVVGPQDVTVSAFDSAQFSVTGASVKPGAPFLYQWQRRIGAGLWEDLTDGTIYPGTTTAYSGTATATLAITRAVYPMSGYVYRCLVGTSADRLVPSPAATLTVNRRPLTVTAASASREYGAADPALTATITGQFPGETAEITGAALVTTSATPNSPVGSYNTVASQHTLSAVNYTFSFVNGTLTVTPKPLTANVAVTKVYDRTTAVDFTGASVGLSGVLAGDVAAVNLNLAGASGSYADKNVGTGKTVTIAGAALSGAAAGNYSLGTVTGTGAITAKPVTSVTTVTKVYDGNLTAPAATGANTSAPSGVISPDDVSLLFSGAPGAYASKNVGTGINVAVAGVTLTGADAGNYSLNATGTGTITARPLTATTTVTKVYDGTTAAPALTTSNTTLTGAVAGETVALGFGTASGTYVDKNVGIGKTVTVTGLTLTGPDAGNYSIGTVTGTGTITAKPITSVTTVTKVYDGNTTAPAPAATNTVLNGVISPDAVSLNFTGASAAFLDPAVGTGKPLTVSGLTLTGTGAGNYTLTATGTGSITSSTGCTLSTFSFSGSSSGSGTAGNIRTFTVNGVSVKASAFSRVKPSPGGALVPAFLGIFSGGLGVTDTSEGDGSGNSHTVDNIGRDNFVLFEFSQPVVVKRANLGYVVSDSDLSVWLGNAADPYNQHLTLTDAMLNGFTYEENVTTSTSARWATLNSGQISGNVLVIAGWLGDTTPEDQFKIGGLEICVPGTTSTPVTLACVSNGAGTFGTAFNSSLVASGGTAPYTYSILSGALPGGLTLNPTTGVISGTPTAAGTFNFTAKVVDSLGTTGNSTASVNCSITIAKAVLTVDADDEIKVYGSANPVLSYVITGFVNGQTLATSGVTGVPALSTTAGTNSPVAPSGYPITATVGTLASANYSFAFIPGILTVGRAPLTITADNKTMTAGSAVPVLTATYVGLVAGDTPATAVSGLTLTTSATSASPAGTYAIVVNGGASSNYVITRINGALTVTTGGSTAPQVVSGLVYLDVNGNAVRNTDEVALGGIVVQAYLGTVVKATATTSATGSYSFSLVPGSYEIDVVEPRGLAPTDADKRLVTVASTAVVVRDIGLAVNFSALTGMSSDGMSQGYWKNNVSKAIANTKKGAQETRANMLAYTSTISNLALSPFSDVTSLNAASSVFNGGDQLSLQLLAAEYNFVSGRFINDSQAVTFAFVAWGEYVLKYRSSYSSTYQTFVKDWLDRFNNGHGGTM